MQCDVDFGQSRADVLLGVQVDAAELCLELLRAGLGEVNVAAVGVGVVVRARNQVADEPDDFDLRRLAVRGACQHQRHQRLVDEHRVGLVDQRDVGVRRHQVVHVGDQLVAQYVESDLVDRAVGDVALVRRAPLLGRRVGRDPADCQPQRLDQRAHPFGIAACEVVVDGDDVHVAAADRIARRGDRTRQRLALTRGHLHDVACQHPQRALQLYVERPQRGGPFGGFSGDRQELRDVGGIGEAAELQQLGGLQQLLVVEIGGLLVELRGAVDLGHRTCLIPVGARPEHPPEPIADTT